MTKKIKKERKKKTFKKRRIKIPNKIRLTLIGIFVIILLFSLISLTNAYQKPTTTQTTVTIIEYSQAGSYNYIAYLNESLIYEGEEILRLGEGTIFRDITRNINGTFLYTLSANKKSNISVSYSTTAQIETEFWNKTYTISSDTPINFSGTSAIFTNQFPIDYLFYENITSQIEEETGVVITDPTLIIKMNIKLTIDTNGETILKTFTPTLTITLRKPTIDIEEGAENRDSGKITKTEDFFDQGIVNERNMWAASSFLFMIIVILAALIINSDEELTEIGLIHKKIMKKYGEWIVDIIKIPEKSDSDTMQVNEIEDLMKISEELGKPIFHYTKDKNYHMYYVLEETMTYQYHLSSDGKRIKIVKCPKCKTKIECKGISGETVHITCPKCKKKGSAKI